jgi:hypothetical protein
MTGATGQRIWQCHKRIQLNHTTITKGDAKKHMTAIIEGRNQDLMGEGGG